MNFEIVHDAQAELGEGPAWDAKSETLYWVDILGKRVHYLREGENGFFQLDDMPGCLAPTKKGTLIVAARASILDLKPATGKQTILATVTEPANNRFNDGKCDPAGRFITGTMNMDEKSSTGALYSFDEKIVTQLLSGVTISNGLAWSPDYKTFYYIDTPTREVKAYDYDLSTGQIANLRVVITVPNALGLPDGMTSQLLEQIPLPAKNITSCAFGGPNLDKLYITSARTGLNQADLSAYRHSGSLMRVKPKVRGMLTFKFN